MSSKGGHPTSGNARSRPLAGAASEIAPAETGLLGGVSTPIPQSYMLLYALPSSAGAIVGDNSFMPKIIRPAKPRILALSLSLKDGLRTAVEGKPGWGNSLSVFYQN